MKHIINYESGAFVSDLLADAVGRVMFVLNPDFGVTPPLNDGITARQRFAHVITVSGEGLPPNNTPSCWPRRRTRMFFGAIAAAVVWIMARQLLDAGLTGVQMERTLFLMRVCDVVLPMVASGIAIAAMVSVSMNEKVARNMRARFEVRRGTLGNAIAGVAK